tara:strand:+ start:2287 stop:2442 length:156 start_codon:yes stop_codon:yes gene_type:complete
MSDKAEVAISYRDGKVWMVVTAKGLTTSFTLPASEWEVTMDMIKAALQGEE